MEEAECGGETSGRADGDDPLRVPETCAEHWGRVAKCETTLNIGDLGSARRWRAAADRPPNTGGTAGGGIGSGQRVTQAMTMTENVKLNERTQFGLADGVGEKHYQSWI